MNDSMSTDSIHLWLVHYIFFYFNPLKFLSQLMSLLRRAIPLDIPDSVFRWLAVLVCSGLNTLPMLLVGYILFTSISIMCYFFFSF